MQPCRRQVTVWDYSHRECVCSQEGLRVLCMVFRSTPKGSRRQILAPDPSAPVPAVSVLPGISVRYTLDALGKLNDIQLRFYYPSPRVLRPRRDLHPLIRPCSGISLCGIPLSTWTLLSSSCASRSSGWPGSTTSIAHSSRSARCVGRLTCSTYGLHESAHRLYSYCIPRKGIKYELGCPFGSSL
jgi:hypothetical protein